MCTVIIVAFFIFNVPCSRIVPSSTSPWKLSYSAVALSVFASRVLSSSFRFSFSAFRDREFTLSSSSTKVFCVFDSRAGSASLRSSFSASRDREFTFSPPQQTCPACLIRVQGQLPYVLRFQLSEISTEFPQLPLSPRQSNFPTIKIRYNSSSPRQ